VIVAVSEIDIGHIDATDGFPTIFPVPENSPKSITQIGPLGERRIAGSESHL
jgi:hypothetical protein